jgi:hypothetical protein
MKMYIVIEVFYSQSLLFKFELVDEIDGELIVDVLDEDASDDGRNFVLDKAVNSPL